MKGLPRRAGCRVARVGGHSRRQARQALQERTATLARPSVVGQQTSSNAVQPGTGVGGDLVQPPPCCQEGLLGDVGRPVAWRTAEREPKDGLVVVAPQGLEPCPAPGV